MPINSDVAKLYKRYKERGEYIVVDMFSYKEFIEGKKETLMHKLDTGQWVEAVPPITREDIIAERFKIYSHGITPENVEKYFSKVE